MDQPAPQGDTLGDPAGTDSNVRYVLSGKPAGWAAMAQTMREYDEDKVKNTKEDIDTLLTFAGLFSAALTAFLVESYQSLLPDPNSQSSATSQQSLVVMQQMYLQVFNGSSQPLIALANPVPPPFEPSPIDIRVNILWFASLTFSLMTASFAILVKQWLREYMAVDYPSPQARLRIRHYRYPQLLTWRVFEIAAVLPLLQQLALALFFIGLCYFTESVHKSVGHTTLPLVAGWALCFAVATFLPVFLPSCPYKTTLLKSVHTRAVHALEGLSWWLSSQYPPSLPVEYSAGSGRISPSSLLNKIRQFLRSIHSCLKGHLDQHEEQSIITRDVEDIKILASVDAIQLNDSLLSSTILESLQQIHQPKWIDIIDLVYALLNHRGYQYKFLKGNFNTLPPLRFDSLTREAYTGIIDIVSHYALLTLGDNSTVDAVKPEAIHHAWIILLSESRYPFPKSGIMALHKLVDLYAVQADWTGVVRAYSKQPTMLAALFRVLRQRMDNSALHPRSVLVLIHDLLFGLFDVDPTQERLSLRKLLELSNVEAHCEAVRLVITMTSCALRGNDGKRWTVPDFLVRIRDCTLCVWELAGAIARQPDDDRQPDGDMFRELYWAMIGWFSHRSSLEAFTSVHVLSCVNEQDVIDVCNAIRKFRGDRDANWFYRRPLFGDPDDVLRAGWNTSADNLKRHLHPLAECMIVTLNLKLIAIFVHLSRPTQFRASVDVRAWRNISLSLTDALHKVLGTTLSSPLYSLPASVLHTYSWHKKRALTSMIRVCLEGIHHYSRRIAWVDADAQYETWLANFDRFFEDSIFEDDFVRMLGRIYFMLQYPPLDVEEAQGFFWLRKLGVIEEVRQAMADPNFDRRAQADSHTEEPAIAGSSSRHRGPELTLGPLSEEQRKSPVAADNGLDHESEIAERRRRILEAVTARLNRLAAG